MEQLSDINIRHIIIGIISRIAALKVLYHRGRPVELNVPQEPKGPQVCKQGHAVKVWGIRGTDRDIRDILFHYRGVGTQKYPGKNEGKTDRGRRRNLSPEPKQWMHVWGKNKETSLTPLTQLSRPPPVFLRGGGIGRLR